MYKNIIINKKLKSKSNTKQYRRKNKPYTYTAQGKKFQIQRKAKLEQNSKHTYTKKLEKNYKYTHNRSQTIKILIFLESCQIILIFLESLEIEKLYGRIGY